MQISPRTYERQIFVCVNEKDMGRHSCGLRGGWDILKKLRDHLNRHGLFGRYNVTKTLCQGHCLQGPAITIYPGGKTFTNITEDDIDTIIRDYLS